ncbi:hypothetical protein BS47DRAFT_529963 [Hydnum rufescens UP504]|uniref:Uncharacterized protein n=1 Tax=Hydnum rufescens UP504 TaxID=1448309 RepID=A0A9P6E0R2_9AGAM|nr:hypothetical protein BS47DRAFT_529963 [Hydnum rufescens UP504]
MNWNTFRHVLDGLGLHKSVPDGPPRASPRHPPRAVNPSVQSWELQVYANAPVLRPEWANLERSGVSGDWVGGVNENGMGEGLNLVHKVSREREAALSPHSFYSKTHLSVMGHILTQ